MRTLTHPSLEPPAPLLQACDPILKRMFRCLIFSLRLNDVGSIFGVPFSYPLSISLRATGFEVIVA